MVNRGLHAAQTAGSFAQAHCNEVVSFFLSAESSEKVFTISDNLKQEREYCVT
jgi:hypothetical protein